MQSHRERLEILDRVVAEAAGKGIAHCRAEEDRSDGRHVQLAGRRLLNFGSCSYLGLELDPRLIEGSIDATRRHGIETSSSRAYLSSSLYVELEALLETIFEDRIVLAPTTTLGHLSALPALVDGDDAIIMDHQVHSSVQMACRLAGTHGAHVEILRHNHLERLEKRVIRLAEKHRQIWYMADGIYSMFGDYAPVPELIEMMDRHPKMRCYVDDAHGMSWCGPRGAGSVHERAFLHDRMVLSTGLAKGFGTGGGVIVLRDPEEHRLVRSCGPTLIFGGPIQPPILGAAIASAKIHLSDEMPSLQAELRERIALCHALFDEHRLPVVSSRETPVGFVATGPTEAAHQLCLRLQDEGIFTNPGQFPATPARRSGGRFLLTRHHRPEDIEHLVASIGRHWEASVRAAGARPEEVWKAFDLEPPVAPLARRAGSADGFVLDRATSIDKLRAAEWDAMLGERGCIDSETLRLYEKTFPEDAASPQERWAFRYYVIRDDAGEPVLATVFTRALWKADMLSSADVSREIEARRAEDPDYLTQWVFAMGCLLSEGDHLWLRPGLDATDRDAAIRMLLEAVRADAAALQCELRVLRDLSDDDPALLAMLEAEGLLRMPAPEAHVVDPIPESDETLVASLGRDHRRHYRKSVAPWNDYYAIDVVGVDGRALEEGEASRLDALYRNVKGRSLELNTFALPTRLFEGLAETPGWELVLFRPQEAESEDFVGFMACHVTDRVYSAIVAGLDYDYVREQGLYRQVLRHTLARARARGCRAVELGFGAGLEKRRVGAHAVPGWMFIEADDHYAFDALDQIASEHG